MKDLPESWSRIEIAEILEPNNNGKPFQQGWSPRCENFPAPEGKWGVLKTTSIQYGEFWDHEHKFLPDHLEPRPHLEVKIGDVLMTCAGPRARCGVACLVERTRSKLMMSGKVYRFRPHPEAMHPKYLSYMIQTAETQREIDQMKTGINDSGLNLTHSRFAALKVVVAPLNEQHRIVAKIEELFSELDKGIESLKTARAQLKIYRQAVLKHAFEGKLTAQWREENKDKLETPERLLARIKQERAAHYERQLQEWTVAVKEWEKNGKSGRKPSKPKKPRETERSVGGVTGVKGLPRGWAHTSLEAVCQILDSRRIPVNNSERLRRISGKPDGEIYPYYGATGQVGVIDDFIFKGEHILLGEDGAPFLDPFKAKAYLVRGKFWVNNHAHILKSTVSNRYVCHYLNQLSYSDHVTGTTRLKLTQDALKRIPVFVAPVEEQHRIVAKIEEKFSQADKALEKIDSQLAKAKILRQAILKKAFAGQLVPQDPDDEPASRLFKRIEAEKAAQSRNITSLKKRRRTTATA